MIPLENDVILIPCSDYSDENVKPAMVQLLNDLGGLEWVTPGLKVGIKANLVTFKAPEAAATTHPSLLCELVCQLRSRGADVVVGDSPGGIFSSIYVNRVYKAAGMHAIETYGGILNQNFREADRSFPDGIIAKEIRYTEWIDSCDVLINFSKLKTHGMMGLSAAVKNMFGLIPGTYKPEYHYRYSNPGDFAKMLIDLNRCFKIQYYLVDAITGMEGNGPTAGTPRHVGCILGSTDPFKLDMICASLMNLPPMQVPTISAAYAAGLCPAIVAEISVNTSILPYIVKDYKNIEEAGNLLNQDGNAAIWGKGLDRILQKMLASRPSCSKKECIGCGQCSKVCPAKAIEMKNKLPHIDRSKCIRCFCCQEFCPKGAMKVARPPIARFVGKL